jgi:hypothetical protein
VRPDGLTPITRDARITRPRRCLGFALAMVVIAGFFAGALVLLVIALEKWGFSWVAIFGVWFLAAVADALLIAYGSLRAGLEIGKDAVVVRNPKGTRRFALAEVDQFRQGLLDPSLGSARLVPLAYLGEPGPGIELVMTDGSAWPVWALGRETFPWRIGERLEAMAALADELNDLLLLAKAGALGGGGRDAAGLAG